MKQPFADRFLHVCYNCAISELDDTVAFFAADLDLRAAMRSPITATDGSLLGIDGLIETAAAFLYDPRGPRLSPAIEVQGWQLPEVVSQPLTDPSQPGIHAIGFAVDDIDATLHRLRLAGCVSVGSAPASGVDIRTEVVLDPRGVLIDLVAKRAGFQQPGAHLSHIRIVCRELDISIHWYELFGFRRVDRHEENAAVQAMARVCLAANDLDVLLVQAAASQDFLGAPAAANARGLFRVATRVENVDAAMAALAERGIAMVAGPQTVAIAATPLPDLIIATVCDPDGIVYELVERPATVFR